MNGMRRLTPQRQGTAVSVNKDTEIKAGRFSNREGGRLGCCAPSFSRLGGCQLLHIQQVGLGAGKKWKSFGKS